jgi:cbb3-type cytochrome oxidase subunit 3
LIISNYIAGKIEFVPAFHTIYMTIAEIAVIAKNEEGMNKHLSAKIQWKNYSVVIIVVVVVLLFFCVSLCVYVFFFNRNRKTSVKKNHPCQIHKVTG